MSWQSYIDNLKTHDQSGKIPVAEAALCGFTQGEEAVWASSGGLTGITVNTHTHTHTHTHILDSLAGQTLLKNFTFQSQIEVKS